MAETSQTVRIAAAGDVHCDDRNRAQVAAAFEAIDGEADLVLLAGDLTTHGEPHEAAVLAEITSGFGLPVYAVLGNHDWHADRAADVTAALTEGGIVVLDGAAATVEIRGAAVGIAGTKGFVGGFPDSELPDFGEPLLRRLYAETSREVEALGGALEGISACAIRVVLLHYSPTTTTLEGERRDIWSFLGSERLAEPIGEHKPHLVLHGHGHAGTFEGFVGPVPVFNVAVPVMGRDFFVFELDAEGRLVRAETEAPGERAPEHAET